MSEPQRLNKIIALLEGGKVAFGPSLVSNGNYEEIMAVSDSGYDCIVLDMEHAEFNFSTLSHSLQYLLNRRRIVERRSLQPDVVPLVRIPPNAREMNQWIIKQTLDLGAYGIVMPHVNTVEEAQAVVAAMRYPHPGSASLAGVQPGLRGWSPSRASRYWGLSNREYYEVADLWPLNPQGEIFLLAIVEEVEGVNNLPRILREVKGISAVWAGFGDLSASLGYAGDYTHPKVEEAIQRILSTCLECNVPCCIGARASDIEMRVKQGFRMILAGPERSLEGLAKGRRASGRSDS